jgi:hypothetical protein
MLVNAKSITPDAGMTEEDHLWELPLDLEKPLQPEEDAATAEKQPPVLGAGIHVPLPHHPNASGEPPLSQVSLEQQRSLNAVISMRLAELHQILIADCARILAAMGPDAVHASSVCPQTSDKIPQSIITTKPVDSSACFDNTALPTSAQSSIASAGGNNLANYSLESHSQHPEASISESTAVKQDQGEHTHESEHNHLYHSASKRQTDLFEFSHTEVIKEQVRKTRFRPNPYNVYDLYHTRGFFQRIAKHYLFENLTLGVIVCNALWISIDTDGNTASSIIDAKLIFVLADCLFFGYFAGELFIRFMAFRSKLKCFTDGWFCFDTALVSLYAFDPFTLGIMAAAAGGAGPGALPTQVLRLFRLARLSRLIRMLRSLPELMILIRGIVRAAKSVGYTLGLLLLCTYVFSIAMRNLTPDGADDEASIEVLYFSSVPEAMHSLIVYGTFLDNLADFIYDVKEQSTVCFIFTWMYISLGSLTIMNMLIGVLCEVITAVAANEKEAAAVERINEQFGQIVQELDTNQDGTLSWDEFQHILLYPEALKALESVDVDAENMVDMAEDFFFEDGEPISVTFEEFMVMVLDLSGGQQAKVKDIMGLGKRINKKFISLKREFHQNLHKMHQNLHKMEKKIARINDQYSGAISPMSGGWLSLQKPHRDMHEDANAFISLNPC